MIAAVVFDMDGVIVDTEQVWDEVREKLVADWGGRYSPGAQRAMMGMSSGEWSRYLHDEVGLPQAPEEISDEVVRRMLDRYRVDLPLIDGAVAAVRELARSFPLAVASSSNRPADRRRARHRGHRGLLRGHGLLGRGRARQAEPRRLPRSRPAARRGARTLRGRGGLGERHPRGSRGRDACDRVPEPALRPGRGVARSRGRVIDSLDDLVAAVGEAGTGSI